MSYSSTTSYRHQRYFCTNSLKRTSVWHGERKCLFPLRIYTALKQLFSCSAGRGCLFSLRIYTALKRHSTLLVSLRGLFSLRIYTALKRTLLYLISKLRLFSLRIYTALKLSTKLTSFECRLFSLRIYTALKPQHPPSRQRNVCFPYEFTLLSNISRRNNMMHLCLFSLRIYTALKPDQMENDGFDSLFSLRIYTALKPMPCLQFSKCVCCPYEFTLLSNRKGDDDNGLLFVFPTNLHCSQTT